MSTQTSPVSGIVRMNLAAMDTADLKLMRGALLIEKAADFDNDRRQALLEAIQDEIDLRRDTAGGDR